MKRCRAKCWYQVDAGSTKPERVEKIMEAICQQWHDRLTEEEEEEEEEIVLNEEV